MNNIASIAGTHIEINDELTAMAVEHAKLLRVARRVLDLAGGPQGTYVDSISGHRVNSGHLLSVEPSQHLQPIKIARHFRIDASQSSDALTFERCVRFAAADIAQAEDAVILLGAESGSFLKKLNIRLEDENQLKQQEGLLQKNQKEIKQETTLLNSILAGIEKLQTRGQRGEYCVIVSPALHREAYTPRDSNLDAPIYQIEPLLRKNGFQFSEAIEGRRGVIFSLARGTVNLAVPVDIRVEQLKEDDDGRPQFRVVEQFRLVLDDVNATVPLE